MDETAKDEARNYITASGFFVMGTTWLFSLILTLSGGSTSDIDSAVYFIVSGGMVIIATLLAVLRKRDLIVIFFLVIVLQNLLRGFQIDDLYGAISVLFFLLVALLNMSLKNKAVLYLWMFPIVLIVLNVNHLLIHSEVLDIICFAAYVFLHYYSAIARAAERINLPLSRAFKSADKIDLAVSGPIIGYMVFALPTLAYGLNYFFEDTLIPLKSIVVLDFICAGFLMYMGILLHCTTKMRFTPVLFILAAISTISFHLVSGPAVFGVGILFIIIGLFALLRKERRIMVGIMMIVYGCSTFFSTYSGGVGIYLPEVSAVLNLIPFAISIYLAAAIYSHRGIPVA